MDDLKITLSIIWVAVMLTYLLGDVLRIFAGDFTPGEIEGKPINQKMYFGISIIMVIPIIMVVITLILDNPLNNWVNIIVAIFFFIFNLAGIRGYKAYDKSLIIVSLVFNVMTIGYAWNGL